MIQIPSPYFVHPRVSFVSHVVCRPGGDGGAPMRQVTAIQQVEAPDSPGDPHQSTWLLDRAASRWDRLWSVAEVTQVVLAGRQGVSADALENPNKDSELRRKPLDRSELGFSDFSLRFRPFAPVFGFFQCNDTRNVTRRERLPSSSRRKLTLINPVIALR